MRTFGNLNSRGAIRRLQRLAHPISPSMLRQNLDEILPSPVPVLLVHASFSQCGQYLAGAEDLFQALAERSLNVGFPTHTYCYPTEEVNLAPVFDHQTTPSRNGLLTDLFWRRSSTCRSIHGTHSLAFSGSLSSDICRDHWTCMTPCGSGTPYERLLGLKASVLMVGVTFQSYTLFHTAEDAAESDFAYEPEVVDQLRVIDEQGDVQSCPSLRQSRTSRRFREVGEHLVSLGLAQRIKFGRGWMLFVPDCSRVHDFLVGRLCRIPDYLLQACSYPVA